MDERQAAAKKRFPGLCLPDNPDRAIQLLVPEGGRRGGGDSKDMRAAKDALDEVGAVVNSSVYDMKAH